MHSLYTVEERVSNLITSIHQSLVYSVAVIKHTSQKYMTGLFPCPPGPSREKIKTCIFMLHKREHGKEKTCVTWTVYLLNLGTHSFFQILYTLLPSLRVSILLRSSFFSFLIFWFQVCFSLFTQTDTSFILAITLQARLSDTILPSHHLPFHFYVLLCTCFH